jgi:hypothetical protein
MISGKGIWRFHTTGLAHFQRRAKDCATPGAPFISDPRSEISLFPDSAGNKGRFAQPTVRFPIFGINDNMLVVVWGLGVLRRVSGEGPVVAT